MTTVIVVLFAMAPMLWMQGSCMRDRMQGFVMGDIPPCCLLENLRAGRFAFPTRRDDAQDEKLSESQIRNSTVGMFRLILPLEEDRNQEREQPGLVFRVDRTKKSVSDTGAKNTLEPRNWLPISATASQHSTPSGITRHHVYLPESLVQPRMLRSKIPSKWEHILRKAVFQSMRRNGGIHRGQLSVSLKDMTDKDLWEKLTEAQFVSPAMTSISKEDTSNADSRVFGLPRDISTVAKGVLVRKGNGFEFRILDQNRKRSIFSKLPEASHINPQSNCVCGVPSPHDGFVALWSVRKIRHSGPGFGFPRFELHFSVLPAANSPMAPPIHEQPDTPPFFTQHAPPLTQHAPFQSQHFPDTPHHFTDTPHKPPDFQDYGQPSPPPGFYDPGPGNHYKGVPVYSGPEYDPRFLAIYREVLESYLRKKRPPSFTNQLTSPAVDTPGPPPTFVPSLRPIYYSDIPHRSPGFRPSMRYHHFSEPDPVFHHQPRRPSITYVTLMPIAALSPRERPNILSLISAPGEKPTQLEASPTPSSLKTTSSKTPAASPYPNSINEQLPPSENDDDANIPYVAAAMKNAAQAAPDAANLSTNSTKVHHDSQAGPVMRSDITVPAPLLDTKAFAEVTSLTPAATMTTPTQYTTHFTNPTTLYTSTYNPTSTITTQKDYDTISTIPPSNTHFPSTVISNGTTGSLLFSTTLFENTFPSTISPFKTTTEQVTIQNPTSTSIPTVASTATTKLEHITMTLVNHARSHKILKTANTTEEQTTTESS